MRKIFVQSALIIVLVVTGINACAQASARWHNWRKQWANEFPTAAWAYFSKYNGSIEEYTIYKNAGLSMVQAPLSQYSNAVSAGLRVVSGGWEKLYENESKLDQYIAFPSANDASTAGYNLVDEPKPSDFANLKTAVARIYQTDRRKAIPIMTMLPNWAVPFGRFGMTYEDFVSSFVAQTNPAVMLSTHYPVLCTGDRPEYYQNIEQFRNHALAKNIGLMGFVLATPHNNKTNTSMCYRLPSESDIYWQVYSMIAYGAQGIWYYNYRIENNNNNYNFGEGLVLHATGQPNPLLYPHVRAANNELHKLAPVLMKLQSVKVSHLHDNGAQVPEATTKYADGMITGINRISGDNFIVSEFKNQDDLSDESPYIMLVNKRHAANTAAADLRANVTIIPGAAYGYVYQYNPENGNLEPLKGSSGQYTINVPGGHGRLVKISKKELIASPFPADLKATIGKDNTLKVQWSVEAQNQASYFEVKLSRKAYAFETIGTIEATDKVGQNGSSFLYEFTTKAGHLFAAAFLAVLFMGGMLSFTWLRQRLVKAVPSIMFLVVSLLSLSCSKDKSVNAGSTYNLRVMIVQVNKDKTQNLSSIVEVTRI